MKQSRRLSRLKRRCPSVHVLDDERIRKKVKDFTTCDKVMTFSAGRLSVYVLTETIYTHYNNAPIRERTYKITGEYDKAHAKLPQNAALAVSEILPRKHGLQLLVAQSIDKLG